MAAGASGIHQFEAAAQVEELDKDPYESIQICSYCHSNSNLTDGMCVV